MILIILFPNQLFTAKYLEFIYNYNKELKTKKYIIFWEHDYYFKKYKYHKLKLAFFRAAMQKYYDSLDKKFIKLYVENTNSNQSKHINDFCLKNKIEKICFFNPIEKEMIELIDLNKIILNNNIEKIMFSTPYFLNSYSFNHNNNIENKLTSIRHDTFYKLQRINYNIMIKKVKNKFEPEGGKWSFDTENRLPFEKNQKEPPILIFKSQDRKKYIKEAIEYINQNFKDNYGVCEEEYFIYPIDHKEANEWLEFFIKHKLDNFGKFEDAISSNIRFGYHSLLSPINNLGLITSFDILEKLKSYHKNIASKEGFIRQVIGWREYCYFVYDKFSHKLEENSFYYKNKNKIPVKIWKGETKIPVIDNIIKNVNKYAYSHHIERLMCMGVFFLITGVSSKEIFKWFQTMYIDAYDVFMIPNVFGMLCFGKINDKTTMMTKPYICSSNYILKMSNYKKEQIEINKNLYYWNDIFDALYYNHIKNYEKEFSIIYSTALSTTRWNNMEQTKQNDYLKLAKIYLDWLHK